MQKRLKSKNVKKKFNIDGDNVLNPNTVNILFKFVQKAGMPLQTKTTTHLQMACYGDVFATLLGSKETFFKVLYGRLLKFYALPGDKAGLYTKIIPSKVNEAWFQIQKLECVYVLSQENY